MEGLVTRHKEAILKRKRAEEEINESYDALYEWNKQEAIQNAMAEMGEEVKSIEISYVPKKPDACYSSDKNEYVVLFKDGTKVTGDSYKAKFHIGDDIVVSLDPFHISPGYRYKDARKLPRERINRHISAMIVFWKHVKDLYYYAVKRKTDEMISTSLVL